MRANLIATMVVGLLCTSPPALLERSTGQEPTLSPESSSPALWAQADSLLEEAANSPPAATKPTLWFQPPQAKQIAAPRPVQWPQRETSQAAERQVQIPWLEETREGAALSRPQPTLVVAIPWESAESWEAAETLRETNRLPGTDQPNSDAVKTTSGSLQLWSLSEVSPQSGVMPQDLVDAVTLDSVKPPTEVLETQMAAQPTPAQPTPWSNVQDASVEIQPASDASLQVKRRPGQAIGQSGDERSQTAAGRPIVAAALAPDRNSHLPAMAKANPESSSELKAIESLIRNTDFVQQRDSIPSQPVSNATPKTSVSMAFTDSQEAIQVQPKPDSSEFQPLETATMVGPARDALVLFQELNIEDSFQSKEHMVSPTTRMDTESYEWLPSVYTWMSPVFYHKPLYFEQPNLERYGQGRARIVQPILSAAHFFGSIPLVPYKSFTHHPREKFYTLGRGRPGNCVPVQRRVLLGESTFGEGFLFWDDTSGYR